jgi:hypothetical protein
VRCTAIVCLAACFVAAGCGGSSSAQEEPDAPTLESLWRAPGEDVAIVPGAADFGPGKVRLPFLVVDNEGRVITSPTARVWLARGLKQPPFVKTTAVSEKIGVEGTDSGEVEAVFVTELELERPGTYWLLAEPVGGPKKIQAVGNVVVKAKPAAPAIGDDAPASKTPTLANSTLEQLTTSKVPDPELYRSSVADALVAKAPFVVAFATPAYCQSRTCGPVVDVVSSVRRKHAASGIRFIHVEIYEDNDPANGVNRWVKQWRLPTEPFTYVVDSSGVIRAKLEGAFSAVELETAAKTVVR